MPLALREARLKIERAKKHILDFDREKISFLETDPYIVIAKFNPETNATESIMGPLPIIPPELAVIAGDAAQNLRTALDYLAAELARSNGSDPKFVYFPIFETVEKYRSESGGKTKGISPDAKDIFDQIEPYIGGQGEGLWWLHSINNADKHRLLMTINANVGRTSQWRLSPEGSQFSVLFNAAGLKEGYVLGEVSGNSEANQRIKFSFDIAFGKPEILECKPVVPVLNYFAKIVETIIDHFDANF